MFPLKDLSSCRMTPILFPSRETELLRDDPPALRLRNLRIYGSGDE